MSYQGVVFVISQVTAILLPYTPYSCAVRNCGIGLVNIVTSDSVYSYAIITK